MNIEARNFCNSSRRQIRRPARDISSFVQRGILSDGQPGPSRAVKAPLKMGDASYGDGEVYGSRFAGESGR